MFLFFLLVASVLSPMKRALRPIWSYSFGAGAPAFIVHFLVQKDLQILLLLGIH